MKLELRAGREAQRRLAHGWDWNLFDAVLGASAGPRWLALGGLDRALVELLRRGRTRPLHLLGASSGAWRFLAYCTSDPVGALERLEEAYIEADWSHRRPLPSIGRTAAAILEACAAGSADAVLDQQPFRLHVVASRCRGPLASDHRLPQSLGLLAAALLAGWSRRAAGCLCARSLFEDPRDPLPARLDDIETERIELTRHNLFAAVLASGSIPLVMPGVRCLDSPSRGGAGAGCYRDGGLIDYHFHHVPLDCEGLVLYPHFASTLWPGWLDSLRRRHLISDAVTSRLVAPLTRSEEGVYRAYTQLMSDEVRGDAYVL